MTDIQPQADADTIRRKLIDQMTRLVAGGETELASELIHPEFVNHEAAAGRPGGPAGMIETSRWLRSCFGELSFEIHSVIVEGDMAAVYATMHGTHEGGLPPGVPASHRPFASRHVHLFRCAADGRALEHWAVRDDLAVMVQAGLLPSPPS